ncbi:MAG: EAL domain-containing protein [Aureliella sp.]
MDSCPEFIEGKLVCESGQNNVMQQLDTCQSLSRAVSTWSLVSVRGSAIDAESFAVKPPLPFTIGRNVGCSIQLKSTTVSGAHAELRPHNDELWLRDLQSTNGTFVNGKRIQAPIVIVENDLVQFADIAFRVSKDQAETHHQTMREDVCDQAFALVQFDRLMLERLVSPAYQPIVSLPSGGVYGVEALARSTLFGMESPAAMFNAAARVDMEVELSRLLRWEALQNAQSFSDDTLIFLNTHPREIEGDGLLASLEQLRTYAPSQKLVLEVHEAAITEPENMKRLREELAGLDILLAYDDFGAGQTRLSELVEAPPHFLKFDISLIRRLDEATPERLKLLMSLVSMAKDLGINPLAEGVETAEEAQACVDAGFESGQGFFYGRPRSA